MADVNKKIIEVKNVGLNYLNSDKSNVEALKNVSFSLDYGKILCIVGPSGCGKSTLLSLISGLKMPSHGEILHRNKKVMGPSNQRVIIFQNYLLFPWKTAIENIEFALRASGVSKEIVSSEAVKFLKLVGLEKFKNNYPHELSGGMQQRIGVARALSCNPDVLLFDEPFASLDMITRTSIYNEILQIAKKTKKSMIFVTHNIDEAIFLGDEIIVMSGSPGKVVKNISVKLDKNKDLSLIKRTKEFLEIESDISKLLS